MIIEVSNATTTRSTIRNNTSNMVHPAPAVNILPAVANAMPAAVVPAVGVVNILPAVAALVAEASARVLPAVAAVHVPLAVVGAVARGGNAAEASCRRSLTANTGRRSSEVEQLFRKQRAGGSIPLAGFFFDGARGIVKGSPRGRPFPSEEKRPSEGREHRRPRRRI